MRKGGSGSDMLKMSRQNVHEILKHDSYDLAAGGSQINATILCRL